ncbi:MAG: hypothetical protein P8Y99_17025, partial [Calditrichaceae bacterium]
YAFDRDWSPIFNYEEWVRHNRLHFIMDKYHQPGACHHQKIVIVDDSLAFVGGFDLTKTRWDTRNHYPNDERRVDISGNSYQAFHDTQFMVQGPVVKDLVELFHHRWKIATGNILPALNKSFTNTYWPDNDFHFQNVNIGIARTFHDLGTKKFIGESERLHL